MNSLEILILLLLAYLPAFFYMIWVRNIEKIDREKWIPIFFCFIWGATIAIIGSLILEIIFGVGVSLTTSDYTVLMIMMSVIIAPFAEELTKPLALRFNIVKKELVEPEDGLIYGAVAGLGFAATENLFYGWDAYLSDGFFYFLILISLRSVVGCLLHASATAWTGYGYGKVIMKKLPIIKVIPYLLLAIAIHGFYNFIPVYGLLTGFSISLIVGIIFVIFSLYLVKNKIQTLDKIRE